MLFGTVGCENLGDGLNGGEADEALCAITVNPTSFATDLEGGEQVIAVTSNGTWTVSCDQTDVTIEPLTGSGNGSVTVTVPAAAAREFKVVFNAQKQTSIPALGTSTTTTEKAEVTVSQNAGGVDQNNYLYYEKCGDDVEKVTTSSGTDWPDIDQFTGWTPEGTAAANVTYSGNNASVRDSGANYIPTTDAVGISGAPYVFLNKVPAQANFVIENIAVTGGKNYMFTYNVSCQNGWSGAPTFAEVDNTLVHLELGYDGECWDAVECTFAPNGGNGWYAANVEFKVAEDATTLYARFSYEAPTSNGGGRFDDFKLVEGGNGTELVPEAPVVIETNIEGIKDAGLYSVKNAWVVATYDRGCLLTDASGKYILAFEPTVKPAVGTKLEISGGVSAYGGLLQFGQGSTITATGETVEVTHPTVETLDAAKVDALVGAIEVKYVEYEGTLSSGQYHNVTITGTTNQGSIQYPAEELKTTLTALNGKYVKVTGYTIGVSQSKYLNTMATSVIEVEGAVTPDPTPDPDQPGQGGGETASVYASDAAFICSADNSTNKCYTLGASKINGEACSGVKFGTSNNAGFFTSAAVGVEGTKTLSFYGMAWKGKTATIYIKVEGSDDVKSVAVKANDGATGNPPYTITVTDADYYSVELTGLTADSKIMFSTDVTFSTASSSAARAVLAGITLK